jgi:hypothetical protein
MGFREGREAGLLPRPLLASRQNRSRPGQAHVKPDSNPAQPHKCKKAGEKPAFPGVATA